MSTAEQLYFAPISLKRILFAMDFSPGSLLAFPYAVSIAKHYGAKIFVAHITPAEDYDVVPDASQAESFEASMEENLSGPMGKLRDIPHELVFDHGSICSKLLATAENRGVDLIVLGTHGWQGLKKLLKGSTAEEISCLASRPVLMAGPNVSRTSEFRRILYATDFSPASQHALPVAFSLTGAYKACLFFLHVNDWDSGEPPSKASERTYNFFREQSRFYGYDDSIRNRSQVIVDFGPRSDLILAHAHHHNADLIVMGIHTNKGVKARIAAHLPGSLTYNVTSQASCPVLAVPDSYS